ncbi:sensor histidine kinase [Granulicoccus sp. GXG6511]|uniref:sensor histidine kinase n=1 Tax=Granulicoccus sp. GXG6511 TaxID=3381351 RepID=UPI003D7DF9D8
MRIALEDIPSLPALVEDGVFRVVTEAVHNAHQHASAGDIAVAVSAPEGQLLVRIVDDGTGLAATAQPGIGLASMRARAAELGGRLDLDRSPAGTRVTLTVPLRAGVRS